MMSPQRPIRLFTKARNLQALLFVALLALSNAGCGGGEGPTDPGSVVPDIQGRYQSSRFVTLRLTPTGGPVVERVCPGYVNVASQTGGSFTGTALWGPGGDCATGNPFDVAGTVRTGGSVTHSAIRLGGPNPDWAAALGCTVVSVEPNFNGVISGIRYTASSSAVVDCAREGRARLDILMDGTK